MEKRRKRPSYLVPIMFFVLEMLMMWLLLGLFNWTLYPDQWNGYSFIFVILWIIFSSVKLRIVLKRQKAVND
jgi:hypothetical protein